jgi:hypothetical protein
VRVLILRGVGYNGRPLAVGEEVELDDHTALLFIGWGKARRLDEPRPDVVEAPTPAVEHREPRVRKR